MSYLPMFSPREYRGTMGDTLRRDAQGRPYASFGTGFRGLGWILMVSGGGLLGVIGHSFFTQDPLMRGEQVSSYIAITVMMLAVFLFGLWMVRWRYTLCDGMLVRRGLIFTRRFAVADLLAGAKAAPISISPHGYFKMKKPKGYLYVNFQYARGMVPMLEFAFSTADKLRKEQQTPTGTPLPGAIKDSIDSKDERAVADMDSPIMSAADLYEIQGDGQEPSIYESILVALQPDGCLPEDFPLPGESEGSVRYALGAKDGIALYHMGWQKTASTVAVNRLASLIHENACEDAIVALLHQERTVALKDELQRRIRFGRIGANRGTLFFMGRQWAAKGRDVELVKLGIAILGAMNTEYDEECREILYTLGLCDEFTYFVLDSVQAWYDRNAVVFELAQRLNGWGKVHAVKMLQADSSEISDWLICHGCDQASGIYNSYIALDCAQKPNMVAYLDCEELSQEVFDGIGAIIEGLLDEGPVWGITEYARHVDVARVFARYLQHAAVMCNSLVNFKVVLDIQNWCQAREIRSNEVFTLCASIINRKQWVGNAARWSWELHINNTIKSAAGGLVDDAELNAAVLMAKMMGYPYEDSLYHLMESDPVKYAQYARQLLDNTSLTRKAIALFEKALPLVQIATGAEAVHTLGPGYEAHRALGAVLLLLHNAPGAGEPLILAALKSPAVSNRAQACRVLEDWRLCTRKQVADISPTIAEAVQQATRNEVVDDLKERYDSLLSNTLTTLDFAEKLTDRFGRQAALKRHLDENGGTLLAHPFIEEEIAQPLTELLLNTSNADVAKAYIDENVNAYISFIEDMWYRGSFDVRNVVAVSILERLCQSDRAWSNFAGYLPDTFADVVDEISRKNALGRPLPGRDPVLLALKKERRQLAEALKAIGINVLELELTPRDNSHFAVADGAGGHRTVPVMRIGIATHTQYLALGFNEYKGSWGAGDRRTDEVRRLWKAQLQTWTEAGGRHFDMAQYYDDSMYFLFYDAEKTTVTKLVYKLRDELGKRISAMDVVQPVEIYSCSEPGYNVVYEDAKKYQNAERRGDFVSLKGAALDLLIEELPEQEKLIREILLVEFWHREMDGFNEFGLARQD